MITAIITNIRMRKKTSPIICKASNSSRRDVGWALGFGPSSPGFESRLSQIIVVWLWANQAGPRFPQL